MSTPIATELGDVTRMLAEKYPDFVDAVMPLAGSVVEIGCSRNCGWNDVV